VVLLGGAPVSAASRTLLGNLVLKKKGTATHSLRHHCKDRPRETGVQTDVAKMIWATVLLMWRSATAATNRSR
jgi:hypothetical protein